MPSNEIFRKIETNEQHDFDFHSPVHSEKVLQNGLKLFNDRKFCDIILVTSQDGMRIPAHRFMLSAASEYFAAMFSSALTEAKKDEITLHEIDGKILEDLVKYMYSGHIQLRQSNVQTLMVTARYLQSTEVFDACCNFLIDQLDPSNCLAMEMFAEEYDCNTLLERSFLYACEHFVEVARHEDFLELSGKRLAILLQSDDLNISSEEQVFHAMVKWFHHDMQGREKFLPELVAFVRVSLLLPAFIAEYVSSLSDLPKYKALLKDNQTKVLPHRIQPRKSMRNRLLAVGDRGGMFDIGTYCPISSEWSIVANGSINRPLFRTRFSAVVFRNVLFVLGGEIRAAARACFNLNTRTWSFLKSMNTKRVRPSVAVLEDLLYAVGGYNRIELKTAEKYDPATDTWTNIASMATKRFAAGIVVLDDLLYLAGGSDGGYHKSVECYDPKTNRWTFRAEMNRSREHLGIATLNGFIYVLGGYNGQGPVEIVERFDPAENLWTTIASLSTARQSICVEIRGESLLAHGGMAHRRHIDTVKKYDAEKNVWIKQAPLNGVFCESIDEVGSPNAIVISISTNGIKF